MNDYVRVRMSIGLFALAIFHVALLGAACYLAHHETMERQVPVWIPSYQPYYPNNNFQSQFVPSIETAPVNLGAQSELKQQCGPCNQRPLPQSRPQASWSSANPFNLALGEQLLSVGPVTTIKTPWSAFDPSATPRVTMPADGGLPSVDRPAPKAVQVMLFLDTSERSRELHAWFHRDPKLIGLRERADFQVFMASSPLYRTRYAKLVPVDQFPVCLVQDASGGHIHAAGKQMIPGTSQELVSDIAAAHVLYKEAKQGVIQQTGAIKTAGYSWDDAISPAMRLQAADCVGPFCPPTQPSAFPAEGLFNHDQVNRNPLQALFFGSAAHLATIFVFGLAAVLLVFILARR